MARLGIAPGSEVTLASESGRYTGRALGFDLPEGSLLAYYPEANVLSGIAVDPRSKTPAFKSIAVEVLPG